VLGRLHRVGVPCPRPLYVNGKVRWWKDHPFLVGGWGGYGVPSSRVPASPLPARSAVWGCALRRLLCRRCLRPARCWSCPSWAWRATPPRNWGHWTSRPAMLLQLTCRCVARAVVPWNAALCTLLLGVRAANSQGPCCLSCYLLLCMCVCAVGDVDDCACSIAAFRLCRCCHVSCGFLLLPCATAWRKYCWFVL
jgi:hypothetical protein